MFWIVMSAPTAVSLIRHVSPHLAKFAAGTAGALILADVLMEGGQLIHRKILKHRLEVARLRRLAGGGDAPQNVVPLRGNDTPAP